MKLFAEYTESETMSSIMGSSRLLILGAGGNGKVILEIAELSGRYDEIVFFDDNPDVKQCGTAPVIGTSNDFFSLVESGCDVFIAVGNCSLRSKLTNMLGNVHMPSLIHPAAVVSRTAEIGRGTVVMAGAIINPSARIGDGCIINSNAVVEHDCMVGNFSHISVSACLAGSVHVGESCFIGAGATVINNINICSECTIGAGAVVVKDISLSGIYVGVPAMQKTARVGGGE